MMVPLPIVGGPRWAGFLEAGLTGQPRWSSLEPWGAAQPTVFSGLISFYPQGPRDRQDHQGLQVPQAPKVTGARQERRAQRVLLVRTPPHTPRPDSVHGGKGVGVSPLSEQARHPRHPLSCWS